VQFEKAKAEGHTPVSTDAIDRTSAPGNATSNGSVYSPAAAGSAGQPPEASGDGDGGEGVSTMSGGQTKRATLSISRRSTSDNESNRHADSEDVPNHTAGVPCVSATNQALSRLDLHPP